MVFKGVNTESEFVKYLWKECYGKLIRMGKLRPKIVHVSLNDVVIVY